MFANIRDFEHNDPVKEISNKISKKEYSDDYQYDVNTSDDNSAISLVSDANRYSDNYTGAYDNQIHYSHAPVNQPERKNRYLTKAPYSNGQSKCDYSINHLDNCDRCYYRLDKLIEAKVNRKFEDLVLDQKMKKLQTSLENQPTIKYQTNWKDLLLFLLCLLVIILFIFLLAKNVTFK